MKDFNQINNSTKTIIGLTAAYLAYLAGNIVLNGNSTVVNPDTNEISKVVIEAPSSNNSTDIKYDISYIKERFKSMGVEVFEVENGPLNRDGVKAIDIGQGNYAFYESGSNYMYIGGAIKLEDFSDVTATIKSDKFVENIEKTSQDLFISYKAENEKASIYVYTDTSCPFCKQFHDSVKELNSLGFTVNYLAFPRDFGQGAESESAKEFAAIYCSENPNLALDKAFEGSGYKEEDICEEGNRKTEQSFISGIENNVNGTPYWLFKTPNKNIDGAGAISASELNEMYKYFN